MHSQPSALPVTSHEDTFLKSSFFEQLVEHVFISEMLQEVYYRFGLTVEVLRSEIDSSGYDIVLECNSITRHVQLKTSKIDGKTSRQNVNIALAQKPSGCVVWILRMEDNTSGRMDLNYLFFGDDAGKPLPILDDFPVGQHSKGNKDGVKSKRTSIRVIPKSQFTRINTTTELAKLLFALSTPKVSEEVAPDV